MELLKTFLESYCHVETYEPETIKNFIKRKDSSYTNELKSELHQAINNQTITPQEYEKLTEADFDSQSDLQNWLQELAQLIESAEPAK